MREIRFRGKRKDNGEWVYGYLIGTDVIVGEIVEFCEEYFNCEYWWRVDTETVGQYTGLKDKNGREIYEGDIIQHIPSKGKGRTFFEKGIFKVEWQAIVSYLCDVRHNCKVIGNIHDNPNC